MYTLTADAAADKLPAASLSAEQRAQLATAALTPGSISPLARQTGTSREFIRRQRDKAWPSGRVDRNTRGGTGDEAQR